MLEKLKSILSDDSLFFAVLLILIGIVSFGLGRQSVLGNNMAQNNTNSAGVVFYDVTDREFGSEEQVVASKSGTKYHSIDCPGAMQMKEENKIYFDSVELAKAAGFQPAANCPELQ